MTGEPMPAETPLDVPGAAAPPTRPLYWSVRREIWENRSLYVAPLLAAAVVLFAFTIRTLVLAARLQGAPALDPARPTAALALPYSMAASLLILTTYLVGAFYCLDALHGERRDRSLLFWKSLPVSDWTAVLAKAAVPLAVLPAIAFTTALATQLAMLLLRTPAVAAMGFDAAALWTGVPLFQMTLVMAYGLAVHALWHAPLYAWLLLVSAWARRAPLLWAVLPVAGLAAFERIAFQTSLMGSLIRHRVAGALEAAFALPPGHDGPILGLSQLDPLGFLFSPGLWAGLLFAAACLAGAARLRRERGPL